MAIRPSLGVGIRRLVLAQVVVGAAGAWAARIGGFSPLWFTPLRIALCVVAGYVSAARGQSGARAGLLVAGVDAVLGVLTLGYGAQLELSLTFTRHRLVAVLLACAAGAALGAFGQWLAWIGGREPEVRRSRRSRP